MPSIDKLEFKKKREPSFYTYGDVSGDGKYLLDYLSLDKISFIDSIPNIQRYFTQLSAAGGQHYTIPEVTIGASDDFELEFTGTFSPSGFWLMADRFDSTNAAPSRILVTATRTLVLNGVDYANGISASKFSELTDGKLHVLKIVRQGATYSLYIDNSIDGTARPYTQRLSVYNSIARQNSAATSVPTFNGYLADVKITINNTLVRHYPLDDSGETNIARELVSGADGTRVNLTQASTERFTKVGDYWLGGNLSGVLEVGDNLITQSDWDSAIPFEDIIKDPVNKTLTRNSATISDPSILLSTLASLGSNPIIGQWTISSFGGATGAGLGWSGASIFGNMSGGDRIKNTNGSFNIIQTNPTNTSIRLVFGGTRTGTISNISVRQVPTGTTKVLEIAA
jgi:hypothetical protein